MRILGLDPGLQRTGWGVIDADGHRLSFVAGGVVMTMAKTALSDRLVEIHEGLRAMIDRWRPIEAAVEETFVNKNPNSTLKLGVARGVALLTPALFGLRVAEYSANAVKKSVVGVGHADKNQVQMMVRTLLPTATAEGFDAADALAVAICHAHHRETSKRWSSLETKVAAR